MNLFQILCAAGCLAAAFGLGYWWSGVNCRHAYCDGVRDTMEEINGALEQMATVENDEEWQRFIELVEED